jgi:hypothetical protein
VLGADPSAPYACPVREHARAIGRQATFRTREGLTIRVKILDVRSAYGRTEYLITPVNGTGEGWVQARRVTL